MGWKRLRLSPLALFAISLVRLREARLAQSRAKYRHRRRQGAARRVLLVMHLRTAHSALRLVAAAGFFWLAIVIGVSLADFVLRY
jgi:hypothetical protein